VDESGSILETVMNENGEVVDEDLVGSVSDLPIEEEYIDDQGRVVSRAKDDSGNVYEQVFDDEGNLVEVRAA
jgi:YD repeat-containing protein